MKWAFSVAAAAVMSGQVPDLVLRMRLAQHEVLKSSRSWGCPSAFNKNACTEYDPKKYR